MLIYLQKSLYHFQLCHIIEKQTLPLIEGKDLMACIMYLYNIFHEGLLMSRMKPYSVWSYYRDSMVEHINKLQ